MFENISNVKPLTNEEKAMHWEEVEELNAEVRYSGKFYTADTTDSKIIFICKEESNPTNWTTLQDGAKFKYI